ncbi:MAG: type II toxin-antitoxin system VapC family toxin, partial [Armatimonadetes bacterium]|nr:type II toxin-antitoxin system VapC family toxin [Armatimonadota bacterium]
MTTQPASGTLICLDASFAGTLLLPEPLTAGADALWESWAQREWRIIAPPHFGAEVVSSVRRASMRGRITPEKEAVALEASLTRVWPTVEIVTITPRAWRRAWEWAREMNRAGIYDTLYLAVAEAAGAEFWTTDENLVRALEAGGWPLPDWVRLATGCASPPGEAGRPSREAAPRLGAPRHRVRRAAQVGRPLPDWV